MGGITAKYKTSFNIIYPTSYLGMIHSRLGLIDFSGQARNNVNYTWRQDLGKLGWVSIILLNADYSFLVFKCINLIGSCPFSSRCSETSSNMLLIFSLWPLLLFHVRITISVTRYYITFTDLLFILKGNVILIETYWFPSECTHIYIGISRFREQN